LKNTSTTDDESPQNTDSGNSSLELLALDTVSAVASLRTSPLSPSHGEVFGERKLLNLCNRSETKVASTNERKETRKMGNLERKNGGFISNRRMGEKPIASTWPLKYRSQALMIFRDDEQRSQEDEMRRMYWDRRERLQALVERMSKNRS